MKTAKNIAAIFLCLFLISVSQNSFAQAKAFNATQGTYHTILEMLRDVPGLDVKSSNDTPGGTVTIRGISNLSKTPVRPVYVVDGAIYNGALSNINPQDVAEISVLKDVASGTTYGSQAMGGVILITTKRGINPADYSAVVVTHNETVYDYFIKNRSRLKVFDWDEKVMFEGILLQKKDNSLVFMVRKKTLQLPSIDVGRVEILQE
jgi:TonB-dependent SusC/RagA subfamily outer membrane receptor